MINAIKSDIESRFGGMTEDKHIWLQIAHTANREAAEAYMEEILLKLKLNKYPVLSP